MVLSCLASGHAQLLLLVAIAPKVQLCSAFVGIVTEALGKWGFGEGHVVPWLEATPFRML